jgi:hypothetical protein
MSGPQSGRKKDTTTARLFTLGGDPDHVIADHGCPACAESYPEPCRCGGLIHAAVGELDVEGNPTLVTACDVCGRSEDQLDEI